MSKKIDLKEIERIQRETIRAILDLFEVEPSEFYYNTPNDYGCIDLKLWTGKGDPFKQYRGEETVAEYRDGRRGTGRYKLNDSTVEMLLKRINAKDSE